MLDCEAAIKSFELTPNASTLMEKMISELCSLQVAPDFPKHL
jgi:hypothetical protein